MKHGTRKKVENLYSLMRKMASGEELYPQNGRLQAELEVDERTLRRYLDEIHQTYDNIVVSEKRSLERGGRKVTIYRVADRQRDVSEVFRFFLESADDLSWLLQLVHENDPMLLSDYAKESRDRLTAVLKEEEGVFQFVGTPFENLDDPKLKEVFRTLRSAVKNREYRTIEYCYKKSERLVDLKCLKLFHMNGNWYLAVETKEGAFRFLRLAFIKRVGYAKKSFYQAKVLEKYVSFFEKVQNPMTLNAPFKTARLLASPRVALYFEDGMKPFFPSQKFIETHEDGSVEFSLKYTQPMEILPFVKQWQPDLKILEPQELRDLLVQDLNDALTNHTP